MGIRDRVNENSRITLAFVASIVVLAIVAIVVQVLGNRRGPATKMPDSYFTVDDGKTFFAASSSNLPPFDYKGSQAVRAYVFECNGKRFVGFVERWQPDARKLMLEGKGTPQTRVYGWVLKRPGDATWIKSGDFPGVGRLMDVRCPDGSGGTPEPVEP